MEPVSRRKSSVDETYFRTSYSKNSIPNYRCPICLKGHLENIDFVSEETAASKWDSREDWWEPEYERSIFRMTLKCSKCEGVVHAHGDGAIEEEYDESDENGWGKYFIAVHSPKHFYPSLQFIEYPPATPVEVQNPLNAAAAMYYSYPAAACNNLRMAAEEILTSLGVSKPESGKFISFSQRIKEIPETSSVYGLLDALRWLGNDGSHARSSITHRDAEDAFRVIDLLVEEVYSDRRKKIQELAAAIREHKGPVRSRGVLL